MSIESSNKQKKIKIYKPLKWAIVVIGLCFILLLTIFISFIGYNLIRPIPIPIPVQLASETERIPETNNKKIVSHSDTTLSTYSENKIPTQIHQKNIVTISTQEKLIAKLVPEDSLENPAQKIKAIQINEEFENLKKEIEIFLQERQRIKLMGLDPDEETEELKKHRIAIFMKYDFIKSELRANFNPDSQKKWNDIFLGLLINNGEWWLAVTHCQSEEEFDNWDTAIYCCRKMGKWEGRAMTAIISCERLFKVVKKTK